MTQSDHAAPRADDDPRRPAWLFDLPEDVILYRDDVLIAVDKPAGIPCQSPDASQPEDLPSLLTRRLQRSAADSASVYLGTHQRLDQDTSGVLLYSLDRRVNAALAEQFRARTIDKRYLAAVSGKTPAAGTLLEHWLVPAAGGTMRVGHAREPGARLARTRVLAVQQAGARSLLTLAIETGRTHQIRVQLAAVGCPVAGDGQYGGAPALRLLLHSSRLALIHPETGRTLELEARAPLELEAWLRQPDRSVIADPALLERALALAAARRVGLVRAYESGDTTAFRWVNGAADGLDDVYVDVYDRWLVLRIDGDDRARDEANLLACLTRIGGFAGAYVKHHPRQANDMVDPRDERFAPRLPSFGEAAPDHVEVFERGVPFEVRLNDGLRTGLFLDQRDNRGLVRQLAAGKRVLNLFGYTGSFSVVALAAGASAAQTVDVSRAALSWADRNVARIAASARHLSVAEDAFVALRELAARGEQFDCIVLDPPSYSTSKHGRFRVLKDYTALCAAALRVLAPDGVLLACVNHHGISQAMLRRFVQAAARSSDCTLESLRDQPAQRDFPVIPGTEPAMKSVIARAPRQPHAGRGMRSASAGMESGTTTRKRWRVGSKSGRRDAR